MNKYLQVHNLFIRTIEQRNTGNEIIQTAKGLFNIDSDRKPYHFSFLPQFLLTCFVFLFLTQVSAQVVTCGSSDRNDACANANGGVYPVYPDLNLTSASGTYAIGTWNPIPFNLGTAGQPRFDFYADAGTIVDFVTTTGQDAEVNISQYNTTAYLLRQDDDAETSISGYPTSNANDETVSYLCPATSWFSIKLSINNCGNISTGTKYLFFRIRYRPCAGGTSYGSGVWNGYVYDGTGPDYFYGSIGTQPANDINVNWGTGQPIGSGCGNMCDADNFSTLWFMNQTYSDGVYVFSTPGNDDGRVLSSNGASTWNLINVWGAGAGTTTTPPTAMNGNYNMVFYQRENSGGAAARLTTCQMSGGNLNVYGSGSWRVYDYADANYNFLTSAYRGTFTSGSANATGASFGPFTNAGVSAASNATGGQCGYTGSGQSIRALLTNTFTAGAYSVVIGNDDNYRISFDGGGTWAYSGTCCGNQTNTSLLNGTYNIVYQGNNGGGGGATYNASITCLPAVAGTLSVSQTCGSSSGTLTLTGQTGYIQWQTSTDGSTWNNSGGLVTSNTLSVSPSTTTFYRAQVWSCGSSVTSNVVAVTSSGTISGNVVIADNVTMGGTINVSGDFTLNATKTITVQQGCPLVINANNIVINGTINADGAGYSGGAGGAGGSAINQGGNNSFGAHGGGGGKGGGYGGSGGSGGSGGKGGNEGGCSATGCGNSNRGNGGNGGTGATSGGGSYGSNSTYAVEMGSGGGGAGGGGTGINNGTNGNAGGNGGGAVSLYACRNLTVSGSILVTGIDGSNGGNGSDYGDGGRCCSDLSSGCDERTYTAPGGGGGGGGGGSGGGILLSAFGNFSCTGTLNAKGGNGGNGGNKGTGGQNNADNGENGGGGGGGRIKIFTNPCATNSIPLQGNSVDNGTGKNNGSIGSFYSGNHPSYTPLDAKTITTANQTICYNTSPAAIDAETSVGGAYDAISSCKTSLPAYQYTWYVAKTTATCAISQTTTSTATSPASGWNLLVGPGTTFEDLTAAQVRAGYQTAGTDSYIPLRIAQAGVMPIIFAGSILQLPQILSMFFLKSANPTLLSLGGKFKSFTSDNLWYMIVYFVLIFFFTYFYTAVTFDAEAMANNLQKNGAFVPNVRPGAPTAEYVATILSRTTFFGAVFFSIIAVMPFILQRMTGNALFAIGGTAILIAVSVCTDLIKKLSAQASMKEY